MPYTPVTPLSNAAFGDEYFEVSRDDKRWVQVNINTWKSTGKYIFLNLFKPNAAGDDFEREQRITLSLKEWRALMEYRFLIDPPESAPASPPIKQETPVSNNKRGLLSPPGAPMKKRAVLIPISENVAHMAINPAFEHLCALPVMSEVRASASVQDSLFPTTPLSRQVSTVVKQVRFDNGGETESDTGPRWLFNQTHSHEYPQEQSQDGQDWFISSTQPQ